MGKDDEVQIIQMIELQATLSLSLIKIKSQTNKNTLVQ